jgi:hypothetical protein
MFSLIAQVARFFRSSTVNAPASHAAALMESADMRAGRLAQRRPLIGQQGQSGTFCPRTDPAKAAAAERNSAVRSHSCECPCWARRCQMASTCTGG